MPRAPGLSVRWRLTLSYAGFLVAAGALFSVVLLLLLRYAPTGRLVPARPGGFAPDRHDLLAVAVPLCLLMIGFLAVVGLTGGWLLAGRVLRPLELLGAAVRTAGQGWLWNRVRMPGRDDEFRRLADGFDRMLDRLESTFEEQRRFTANASHELRTPHAVMKTMLQVARADPAGRDVDELLRRLAETNDRAIDTLEALLQLSRVERTDGVAGPRPCDLALIMEESLEAQVPPDRVRVETSTDSATVLGDRAQLGALADNLLRNALVHNVSGGTVWIVTGRDPLGRSFVSVENTGPDVPPDLVPRLTEPFVRGTGRTRSPGVGEAPGSGLGLAIVAAVVGAHGADLDVRPRPGGGLRVVVRFPVRSVLQAP
ncbi:sensor histidine kinase [Spongisporangium articulatum]|uniref:histidine kinase n=1 Tax=Spongisporangium articulatum TaxID=3362603 RepID=A0ABW8ARJ7_9ACTN